MGILNKIRRRFGKPKDKLEEQERPDDIGVIRQQQTVGGKVESVYRMTSKNLLSREEREVLLIILKKRFLNREKSYKTVEGVKWEDVQKKLDDSPEKMWSLQQMEETGGQPDIMDYDKKTGEYIFMDCSAESPEGRRYYVYDKEAEAKLKKNFPTAKCDGNAISSAALMGVEIFNEKEYRDFQAKGEFDKKSWTWIKTPVETRKSGVAFFGARGKVVVYVNVFGPSSCSKSGAFRGMLRV